MKMIQLLSVLGLVISKFCLPGLGWLQWSYGVGYGTGDGATHGPGYADNIRSTMALWRSYIRQATKANFL